MKRRQVITAFGTLAIGTGTALGTGAFDATSTSSSSAMSIVTQNQDADIEIVPGDGAPSTTGSTSGNIKRGTFNSVPNVDQMPIAAVSGTGPGMVQLQVYTTTDNSGSDPTFSDIIEVNNLDNVAYNVGFVFSGISNVSGDDIEEIYQFRYDSGNGSRTVSEEIQPDSNGDFSNKSFSSINPIVINTGGSAQVSLDYDAQFVPDEYDLEPGNFSNNSAEGPFDSDGDFDEVAESTQFVNEVTAVANETTVQ
ncbi:hypothetical protein [Halobellus rubicundus]|uniref:DUF1102 domain-containing protein n=1 Tax=Halobellus rubicundus TaxID=2996466 RepID=A0ABD5M7V4_9EURY